MTHERTLDEGNVNRSKSVEKDLMDQHPTGVERDKSGLVGLQQTLGNQAVQRLISQRKSEEPTELDDDTADRIKQARGGGQALDSGMQERMGAATGQDLSGVRVHTSPEAGDLNQQLNARAFTTGRDVFFREGAYDPHSSSGQELIAHELSHVVQQTTGQVASSGSKMTVNAPGDRFEREADSVAKSVTAPGAEAQVQRFKEGQLQMQTEEEEEAIQTAQMQEEEEDEELQTAQMQPEEEEEEPVQAQMQAEEEPEEEL
jgi:hypothetical protein